MFMRDSAMSNFQDLLVTSCMTQRQKGARALLTFISKAMRLKSIWMRNFRDTGEGDV